MSVPNPHGPCSSQTFGFWLTMLVEMVAMMMVLVIERDEMKSVAFPG